MTTTTTPLTPKPTQNRNKKMTCISNEHKDMTPRWVDMVGARIPEGAPSSISINRAGKTGHIPEDRIDTAKTLMRIANEILSEHRLFPAERAKIFGEFLVDSGLAMRKGDS